MRATVFLFLAIFSLSCGREVPVLSGVATTSRSPTTAVAIPTSPPDILIPWQRQIGNINYRWDGKDLYSKQHSRKDIVPIFALATKRYRSSFEKDGGRCSLSTYFIPAAVVGDLVSYEFESGFFCDTASGEWRYATLDVARPKAFLDLRDFFDDDQILRAFLTDPQLASDIQKSIAEKKLDAVPTTLESLSSFLTKFDYQIYDGNSFFEADYLTRFAFHHLEGEAICIRVSATSTSTAGRANHQYAEIFLPVPNKLRDVLQKADTGSEGFLMKNSATKVGTLAATLESRF